MTKHENIWLILNHSCEQLQYVEEMCNNILHILFKEHDTY